MLFLGKSVNCSWSHFSFMMHLCIRDRRKSQQKKLFVNFPQNLRRSFSSHIYRVSHFEDVNMGQVRRHNDNLPRSLYPNIRQQLTFSHIFGFIEVAITVLSFEFKSQFVLFNSATPRRWKECRHIALVVRLSKFVNMLVTVHIFDTIFVSKVHNES